MMKPGEQVPRSAALLEALRVKSLEHSALPPAVAFIEMVQQERARQDKKWGPNNYSNNLDIANTVLGEEAGEFAKAVNDDRQGATKDDVNLVVELVQTAAVAQAIYEQVIHRRRMESKDGRRGTSDK